MKHIELTSEWLDNWRPARIQEVADRGTRGLSVRCGPTGKKVFYTWVNELADPAAITRKDGAAPRRYRRRRLPLGEFPMLSLAGARKMLHDRRETRAQATYNATVGRLLDLFIERGQASEYTADLLKKHVAPIRSLVAVTLPPPTLPDLVAKVQKGYVDEKGRAVGGPAVADKVRGGLRSLFGWAQRQGHFPADRPLPTLGLVREDFKGIGWQARERSPSEGELHRLFAALGIGAAEHLEIDLAVSPRIPLASRLAVLLLMHVPVRSGVGLLAQPADAADLDRGVLRWATHKGKRDDTIETPLSATAKEIVQRLRKLPGGATWLIPSPEDPTQPIDTKALARLFARLQAPGRDGKPPRVAPDKGKEPFVPHTLRALWSSLAGDLGIHDGVAVRVIGHKPEGASAAQRFYDHSLRLDLQREAVERVSAELERIRRREVAKTAAALPLRRHAVGAG
ncbi:hypothetical protein [Anaeromyxobacter sp. Fw109-5]|uniref:tyrosine-type recombinase/integrase n=1 Tax=Anaeromyxobacter sp. (strain Fw109-5) TaxID=404589 RepID=UPI0002E2C091|nr:hypothetical protein [Anaeromyxobacter sp. Fw109-5]